MALSYSWQNLIDAASRYGKGIPLTTVDAFICNMVSSDMYIEYPWKETVTTTSTAPGLVPLLNNVQDYSPSGANMSRLLTAALWNTTQTPADIRNLDIMDDLAVDLYPRSYITIRAVSLQKGVGKLRLEAAVNIPTGMSIDLRYDYQLDPTKVTSLAQDLWFHDKYAFVALEGLLYYVYKLSDDPRAGSSATDAYGRSTGYNGQLGIYKSALNRMKAAEDYGSSKQIFPGDAMGLGRDQNSLNIFGW